MTVESFVASVTRANEELATGLNKSIESAREQFGEYLKTGGAVAEAAWPATVQAVERINVTARESFDAAQRLSQLWLAGKLAKPEGGCTAEGGEAIAAASAWAPGYFAAFAEVQRFGLNLQKSFLKLAMQATEAAAAAAEESSAQALRYAEAFTSAWSGLALETTEAATAGKPSPVWCEIAR